MPTSSVPDTAHNKSDTSPNAGPSTNPSHATTCDARTAPAASSASPVLGTLRDRVENLPDTIPIANNMGDLAGFSNDPAALTKGLPDNEIWEVWDPQLNALISQTISDIFPLVTCGNYGLIGLVRFFEHLVYTRNLDAGLLDGKIGRILQAIDMCVSTLRHIFDA
jgi:hypothetical protein